MNKKCFRSVVFIFILFSSAYAMAGDYAGKKILHIDSYHKGYEWSDGIDSGIKTVLQKTEVTLKKFEMDTKRNSSEEYIKSSAIRAKAVIEDFKPDVVIASDDNASKYLIMPYYKDADLPFVFCGVNWDASIYGFPYKNVTGMVEVDLAPQIIRKLRNYSKSGRLGFIAFDSLSEHKIIASYNKILNVSFSQVYLAKTFKQWKARYLEMQRSTDIGILSNHVGIPGWNDENAQIFVEKNTKIPTGTSNSWQTNFALIGMTKVPEEQGQWAARAALKILDGISPGKIPITHNKQGKLFFNLRIGKKLGITEAPAGAYVIR